MNIFYKHYTLMLIFMYHCIHIILQTCWERKVSYMWEKNAMHEIPPHSSQKHAVGPLFSDQRHLKKNWEKFSAPCVFCQSFGLGEQLLQCTCDGILFCTANNLYFPTPSLLCMISSISFLFCFFFFWILMHLVIIQWEWTFLFCNIR